ncbi:hypothetical protein SD70_02960 [Gordoniibacillus kamchatkensis]|uniref:HAMP domain-containing protein n=1 Tax=Gordoniibacillus kamchatkensis TaxID=1590651 RepID=A0ABR5AP61_9BACL|nr:histidine kinase [Paenibacillus sp. VKM B-2647]KIL42147.1 hypothetical protein SD70_02960 [Paenibacillus sp. VKM B-2647]
MLPRLVSKFRNLSIVKKMAIGYFVIVFIPIISFGLILYNQNYNRILDEYAGGREKIIDQVLSNLKVNTIQIESVFELFQYNSNTVDYLSGTYRTDFDQVNNFLKYIRPLFSYIYSSNKLVDTVKIYLPKQNDMVFRPEMAGMDEFPYGDAVKSLPLGIGEWKSLAAGGQPPGINLHYFRKIGNRNYEQEIGLLDISVSSGMIAPLLRALGADGGNNLYVLNKSGQEIYRMETKPLSGEKKQALFRLAPQRDSYHSYQTVNGEKMLMESFYFDGLQMKFIVLERIDDVFRGINKNRIVLLLAVSALLLALSGLYYMIALSITRRILKLSSHMRKVGEDYFPLYRGDIVNDEVGQLTISYNKMIHRIDELVNSVHRSEMMRKEAAYQMMQAQIKPHFLYNTLESIRMIAEANDDPDAAHMSYSLGKLLRYSLSSAKSETVLLEEIENVKEYIHIQSVRLGDRLQVSFQLSARVDSFVCPRFILQPLVENSIVHGIAGVRKRCTLTIRVYEDSSHMYVDISDTGAGIEEGRLRHIQAGLKWAADAGDSLAAGGGVGLYNVNERVKMFYGKDSGIRLESVYGEGTSCTLRLCKGESA